MPGGPELVEFLRAQRAQKGILAPGEVNQATSGYNEVPSGGAFAPLESGEGANVLSALGGAAKMAGKYLPVAMAGYQIGDAGNKAWQSLLDQLANPSAPSSLPIVDASQPTAQDRQNMTPMIQPDLMRRTGQRPMPNILQALGAPAPASPQSTSPSQPGAGATAQPQSLTDGAGAQTVNDGGVGPVLATQGGDDTSNQTSTPVTQAPSGPSVQSSGDQTNSASPTTMGALLEILRNHPAWSPTPIAQNQGSVDALAQVTKQNAAPVQLGADGNAPGVSGFQRFLAAGSGPFDWHRADRQRIQESQEANQMTDKERTLAGVAGADIQGKNSANTQLRQAANASGNISPADEYIMNLLGGQVGAQSAMKAKLAEIDAENQGKLNVARANPDYVKTSADYMQRESDLSNLKEIVSKSPDLLTPAQIAKMTGNKTPSGDDLADIQNTLHQITAARGFSPDKVQQAILLQTILPRLQARLGAGLGSGSKEAAQGGPAPSSGGRPSNLNLEALNH